MPLTQRYQVLIIDRSSNGWGEVLKDTLKTTVGDMGMDPESDLEFLSAADSNKLDERSPKAAVFFGPTLGSPLSLGVNEQNALDRLGELAAVVFPVLDDLAGYSARMPAELQPINGTAVDPNDPKLEGIANLVLEALYLIRGRRRLFISYLRRESRAAALQLFEKLESRDFTTFLDTHSVRKGEAFQDVLWHKMTDSDVVVLLHTPNLEESGWVQAEIQKVNEMGITVLEVIWPGVKRGDQEQFHLFHPIYVDEVGFEGDHSKEGGARFTDDVAEEISTQVEHLRARAIASRETRLVKTLCDAAKDALIVPTLQSPNCVDLALGNSKVIRVHAGIGVPESPEYHRINSATVPPTMSEARLLYDAQWLLPSWQGHLDWLDQYLPTKRILLTDLENWLRAVNA